MANEEKIKAFFSDEEKVKALANDEEFMSKVSGGTATAQTYKDEFKKFGIELGDDEAKGVLDSATKFMNIPVKKLDEIGLENVSGGVKNDSTDGALKVVAGVGLGVGVATFIAGMGCCIAGIENLKKMDEEYDRYRYEGYNNDDVKKFNKMRTKNDRLYKATIALMGISAVPLLAGVTAAAALDPNGE